MTDEIVVEFDGRTHSLNAVRAAAYRLIGRATCKIDATDHSFVCRLEPAVSPRNGVRDDHMALRASFLDLVSDETLRESVSIKTEAVRNLILSLAFGSLVAENKDQAADQ